MNMSKHKLSEPTIYKMPMPMNKMKYETFKAILKALEKQHEVDRQINKVLQLAQSDTYFMGTTIDEIGQAFDTVFKDAYDERGLDLIQWWLYEDVEKLIYAVKTDEVLADLTEMEDLWNYVEAGSWND
jgi:hypothetical protein